ncbi:MAG: 30S ribosomal protein S6 [Candidatus Chisholmbacteria bacterium RIFCSPHIGHO2_01_FULL_48_12]|uniref:Small ribosomal subunit protein bS6 n=1 Tax=Candidatus Chisholmbacteria bacterium RIFCSPHIGHO2_01_FULL_48_12 TaxID=1797589 RepID=A0A1G1VQM6_9BACT|nr:MAG: 30S ribosomal protein S6 [Candidatus Chisholmbacteria bacterium RIFCSPHIGHO2_01_FULL_48_12]
MTRNYELVVVFSPQLNEKDLTAATAEVVAVVEKAGGKAAKMIDWGKKDLSYPIKKETSGIFRLWPVALAADKAAQVDKELRLKEGVLRFLLVVEGKHGKQVAE